MFAFSSHRYGFSLHHARVGLAELLTRTDCEVRDEYDHLCIRGTYVQCRDYLTAFRAF